MKLILVLRVLSIVTVVVCTLLSLVTSVPLAARMRWFARVAGASAFGTQVLIETGNVRRRSSPWTKLLVPIVGLFAAIHTLASGTSPIAALSAGAAVEIAVLLFAVVVVVRAIRRRPDIYPEDIAERELARFTPSALNRYMAAEILMIGAAAGYLLGGFLRPLPSGFSYVRTWSTAPLLMAMPLLIVPEAVVLDIVLAHTTAAWGWRAFNIVAHLYALLWSVGIFAVARIRPHRSDGIGLRLRFGALRKIDVPLANICATRVLSPILDARAFARTLPGDGSAFSMALEGAPAVALTLRDTVTVYDAFRERRNIREIVVAVDDPYAFTRALAATSA